MTAWLDLPDERRSALTERFKKIESSQRTRMKKKNEKLPAERQIAVEKVDFLAILIQQDWACSICCKPMDPTISGQLPMSVSLEHNLGVMSGGNHVESNISGAHRRCNVRKGHLVDAPMAAEIKRKAGDTGQRARRERRKAKQLSLWPARKLESRGFSRPPGPSQLSKQHPYYKSRKF